MKRANLIATAGVMVVVGMGMPTTAGAQDFTGMEKSILTFSAPVELPGMTLQTGTYVFRRPDPNTARIIQVFSQDEKNILGQFQTIPATRLAVTSENVVTFKETREGVTPAVHYWYYPGRGTGHEFLYPKEQAMKIAARTGEKVATIEENLDANAATAGAGNAPEQKASAAPEVSVNRQASASTAAPEAQIASNRDTSAQRDAVGTSGQSSPGATDTPSELPKTASPLPLVGLIGLLALGGFAAMRLREAL